MSIREEFEAWATKVYGMIAVQFVRDGEEYENFSTQGYWDAWQASRSVLVVEPFKLIKLPPSLADHPARQALEDELEKVGVKVNQ